MILPVACVPLPEVEGAVGGRELDLPCPADAGRANDGPAKSSSSMAATPLGCGRPGSAGVPGRILAAEAVAAWADCRISTSVRVSTFKQQEH